MAWTGMTTGACAGDAMNGTGRPETPGRPGNGPVQPSSHAAPCDMRVFRRALEEAERTFDHALAGDPTARLLAPMLHTAACHNLAVALTAVGAVEEARGLRLRMLSSLVQHASSPSCPLPLRINCVRHMRPAVGLLLSAAAEDAELVAEPLVEQARRAAHEVVRVAGRALGLDMVRASPGDARPAALH